MPFEDIASPYFTNLFGPWAEIPEEEREVSRVDERTCCEDAKAILDESIGFNTEGEIGYPRNQVLCNLDERDDVSEDELMTGCAEAFAESNRKEMCAWTHKEHQEFLLHIILDSEYGQYILWLMERGVTEKAEIIGSVNEFTPSVFTCCMLDDDGSRAPFDLPVKGFHLFLGLHIDETNPKPHVKFFEPLPYTSKLKIQVGDWIISKAHKNRDITSDNESNDTEMSDEVFENQKRSYKSV